jgi:Bacterial PH domain
MQLKGNPMGLLSGMLGLSSEADVDQVESQLEKILIPGEKVEMAYKLVRDMTVLTNRRIILVDKQGVTGKKTEYISIPYKSIVKFTVETAGHFDLDADVKLWLSSHREPTTLELRKSGDISQLVQTIAKHTC